MGLFSFLKNKGAKLFGKKSDVAAKAAEVKMSKADELKAEIARLGLNVSDLGIELCEQVIVSGTTKTNADREKVILALGNVEGVGSVDDQISVTNPEPAAQFYTVQPGDSLSLIAEAVYRDAMKYPVIFEANKPMLKDPNLIYPGQVLRIPALK